MDPTIRKFAVEQATATVRELTGKLKIAEGTLIKARAQNFSFRVKLTSLWSDKGEQDVFLDGNDLKKTYDRARKQYQKTNQRTDDQFKVEVFIIFDRRGITTFSVPEEIWKPLVG